VFIKLHMKKSPTLLIYIYFFLIQTIVYGQQDKHTIDEDLKSPRATIATHLGALEEENCDDAIAAKPFLVNDRTLAEAKKLAVDLKKILIEKEIQLELGQIPDDQDYIDPKAKFHKYQLSANVPQIYLVRVHNQWIYSETTIKYINQYYKKYYFFGKTVPLEWLYKLLHAKLFFKLRLWQLLAILTVLLSCIIVFHCLQFLFTKLLLPKPTSNIYPLLCIILPSFSALISSILGLLPLALIHFPTSIGEKFWICQRGFTYFFAMLFIYRLVDLFDWFLHERTINNKINFNLVLIPMLKVGLKVLIVIIGIIVILQSLGFNVKGLLAGVGIGGLGFALASQDTIKNFFGSLVILTDKPFNIGDHIVADKLEGKIEEIGFRSTRISTKSGSVIYIPNGKLADNYINNYGKKQFKNFTTTLAIDYTTPLPMIEAFLEGLRKIIQYCPTAREGKSGVYLYDLQSAFFYIKFDIHFDITDEKIEFANREITLIKIKKLAACLGIQLAYPTYALNIKDPSLVEIKSHSCPEYVSLSKVQERLKSFFEQEKAANNQKN